jgi:hypothetical protein
MSLRAAVQYKPFPVAARLFFVSLPAAHVPSPSESWMHAAQKDERALGQHYNERMDLIEHHAASIVAGYGQMIDGVISDDDSSSLYDASVMIASLQTRSAHGHHVRSMQFTNQLRETIPGHLKSHIQTAHAVSAIQTVCDAAKALHTPHIPNVVALTPHGLLGHIIAVAEVTDHTHKPIQEITAMFVDPLRAQAVSDSLHGHCIVWVVDIDIHNHISSYQALHEGKV